MELEKDLQKNINENTFIYGVFSVQRNKAENPYKKITVKPILMSDGIVYQLEKFTEKQAFHENVSADNINDIVLNMINNDYRNINLFTVDADYQILVSKKGVVKTIKSNPTKKQQIVSHNNVKQYLIKENVPCDFLVELGVMNADGKVLSKKYDKFKQINKFLEIVDDAVSKIDIKDNFRIIDFGCGKAYLTFALYYYFYNIRKVKVNITGLDLKEDVIKFCNEVAQKLNYEDLVFENGDIKDYNENIKADMVVTLHACDNATDAALVKAIKWDTKVILSVPCCQHEFFNKIKNDNLEPMLKHGLIKERVSSLVTDSLRSLFLETKGYKVNLVEFVDMEHTPKNIMIRAIKNNTDNKTAIDEYEQFKRFWNLDDIFIENYFNQ